MTAFLKPDASTSTRYGPGGTCSKTKIPLSLVVWLRAVFVSVFVSVTVAPLTTFPCGSATVPRTDDVLLCARAVVAKRASKTTNEINRLVLLSRVFLFMESSVGNSVLVVMKSRKRLKLVKSPRVDLFGNSD